MDTERLQTAAVIEELAAREYARHPTPEARERLRVAMDRYAEELFGWTLLADLVEQATEGKN
jgi:hypothetical protein